MLKKKKNWLLFQLPFISLRFIQEGLIWEQYLITSLLKIRLGFVCIVKYKPQPAACELSAKKEGTVKAQKHLSAQRFKEKSLYSNLVTTSDLVVPEQTQT